jgi:predicted DsbA family dithiol-disulfide isomerase
VSTDETAIIIDYYTDMLCVWAWIAQPRLDEIHLKWGDRVKVRNRYFDVFGDSHGKIKQKWGDTDGFDKFGDHVVHAASAYDYTRIDPSIWTRVRPRSSTPSHLLLKAVECIAGEQHAAQLAQKIRRAFFCEAQDISDRSLLLELAGREGLDKDVLEQTLGDGRAMAELSRDQRSAAELSVRGSPTWVLNEGRQVLYGNVGYRILAANIEELAKHQGAEASWC